MAYGKHWKKLLEDKDMKLNSNYVSEKEKWLERGYRLPEYDISKLRENTKKNPQWIHFGAGNIFRSFMAHDLQKLLEEGKAETGLIVVDGFDCELIDRIYRNHDNLSILVTLNANGNVSKEIIGSVSESIAMDRARVEEFERLKEIFRNPGLQMASFTLTEKGYNLTDNEGCFLEWALKDMEDGPDKAEGYIGRLTSMVYERYLAGKLPIALVSMDNCSHNGEKLKFAITSMAKGWVDNGVAEEGFLNYLYDDNSVSFPWSMIDKITPRPDSAISELLKSDGVEEVEPVITSRNTYASIFVNAEKPQYLVIEDSFPNGHPALEEVGVIFTDRATVNKVERMKVCTCLNPLHTALAIFGCLLSYTKISDEMNDDLLKKLVYEIGYKEGLPVVTNPKIINPEAFIDEVLTERIPNPFMPDTPQRIATDTSQKIPIRFGETIKAYMEDDNLDSSSLTFIPLVLAGWIRYMMAVDDNGEHFELSSDPMIPEMNEILKIITLGCDDIEKIENVVGKILENKKIFAVDLYEAGLAEKIMIMFTEMIKGPGEVRKTLDKYVQ